MKRKSVLLMLCCGVLLMSLAACQSARVVDSGVVLAAESTPALAPATVARNITPTSSATFMPPPTGTRPPPLMPEATFTSETAACAETRGQVLSTTIPSKTLRYPINARLYLPPCYAANTEARYPVLYLMHGLNFKEDQWVRLGVVTATDTLIAAGEIAPLIIVMPRDRLDDRLDRAFVNDLVPYMDANYRTVADRRFRALGGLSRGAGWAMHIGLQFPAVFSRLGAHSPAVFIGDESDLIQWTWHMPKDQRPQVYIDIGEGDSLVHSAAWLDQIFTYSNIPHTFVLQDGAHSEKYWAEHMAEYLKFYAADWRNRLLLVPTLDPAELAPAPTP